MGPSPIPPRRIMAEWQGFYSTVQVSRLARIPTRTLYSWKAQRIIVPSVKVIGYSGKEDEGYSYADLAIVKLLRGLRDKNLNLRSVAIALRHLFERFGSPTSPGWQTAHIYVLNKVAYAQKPDEWETTVATKYGQKAMDALVADLFEEEATLLVPRSFGSYVEINPDVVEGMPVIRDTRIPTATVAMLAEQGTTLDELAQLYVRIPRECLERAIEFERALDKTPEMAST